MIDFNKVKPISVTKEFVLSKVDDATIFTQYFGTFEIKRKVYKSVFTKDNNPSTGFYVSKTGIIKYSDLRTRENWDCFSFVAKLYNITYAQAIRKIAEDFGLISTSKPMIVSKETFIQGAKVDRDAKEKTIIQVRPDKWTDEHLAFWRKYDITEKELIDNNVYPILDLYINKKKIYNKNNFLRFAYRIIHEGEEYMKIYSPFDKSMKWISNIPLNIPFGLETLPHSSNRLIITKSMKDLIVLKKIFTDVIATQNEGTGSIDAENFENWVGGDYIFKTIFWDNDETGVENCKKFNDKGFDYFNIPHKYYDKYKIKDASDFVAYFGVDALKELFIEKNIL